MAHERAGPGEPDPLTGVTGPTTGRESRARALAPVRHPALPHLFDQALLEAQLISNGAEAPDPADTGETR